jgi:hypothetical protein
MPSDQTDLYRSALVAARAGFMRASKRMEEITAEADRLTEEITKLRRTITALSAMCSEAPGIDKFGITESCLKVMEQAKGTMTTADVVAGLDQVGFDLASQKNAPASVHAVLMRLAVQKKITRVQEEGKAASWRGPQYNPDDDIPF